ncbi:MAG: lanthionine synthetase LanC family protein [Polyangia bacterium]
MTAVSDKDGRWLAAASAVGDELCATALVHGELCTWIGRSLEEADPVTFAIAPVAESLGTDLYGGTAGIALFLAQLAALGGRARHSEIARSAIRHALRRPLPQGGHPLGFYSGTLGIAYAAAQTGALLQDEAIRGAGVALALKVLRELDPELKGPQPIDIIGGCAGAILALLALPAADGGKGGAELREGALRLGRYLCQRAEKQPGGQWLWYEDSSAGEEPTPDGQRPWPMTGYSHGAAGITLALAELYALSREPLFREAALGGITYEDRWFSAAEGNWPDLRTSAAQTGAPAAGDGMIYGVSWCHGAPGIALSRLRELTLLPDDRALLLRDIDAGLGTTNKGLIERQKQGRGDATPCHGSTGLAEALLVGGQALGVAEYTAAALATGQALLDDRKQHGAWLSGCPTGGPNPSLLLGSAGVGYFFLRLHDPARVPSILLPPHALPV